jgi:long-subunit fatty acid transport protein
VVQPESEFWFAQAIRQTGDMKGLNLAFSYRLTRSFSLGVSASYVFGDIDRVQEMPEVTIMENGNGWQPAHPGLDPNLSMIQNSAYDAKGFFFNLGFTWEPSSQLLLGLSLRPPFSLDVQTEMETTDSSGQRSYFSQDNYFKHPLVAVASLLFHPLEPLRLTADLSYWGWGEFSTDIDPGRFGYYDLKSVLKFNLGAEYEVRLPFDWLRALALRAGFIYDPQPYRNSPGIARDSVTFGFSLPVGRLDLQFAAKLGLSANEKDRFHSDVLQAGAAYRF